MNSELDEVMDKLPLHLRNKVLKVMGEDEPIPKVPIRLWVIAALEFIFLALPLTTVGLLICVFVITIPIGVALMGIGCYPLKRTVWTIIEWKHFRDITSREETSDKEK